MNAAPRFVEASKTRRRPRSSRASRAIHGVGVVRELGELEGQCALRADGDASSSEETMDKARELFNRACVVDKKNVAAWLRRERAREGHLEEVHTAEGAS